MQQQFFSSRHKTLENATVILTGAAGFIGSHTAEQLIGAGHRVIGLDDLSTGKLSNLWNVIDHENFTFVEGDVLEGSTVADLCRENRADAIIHLAGLVSVVVAEERPAKNFRLNLEATHFVADAARVHNVKRVVFASSAAVYGDISEPLIHENCPTRPIGMYGSSKLASENLLLGYSISYDMEVVCMRYFNVYGDRQDPTNPYSGVISIFSDRFARGVPVTVYGNGEQTRDFISVRDVARGNVLAATTLQVESGSRNVCTGKSRSINELIQIFSAIYPDAPKTKYAETRAAEIIHSCGNGGYAAMVLGFEPYISMEDGLCDLVAIQRYQEEHDKAA
ncbi:MAG: UDP-glucose 4-epimerase [Verrucomicrobiales bacterium]|jgi:UDP-glucose 4-epimerase